MNLSDEEIAAAQSQIAQQQQNASANSNENAGANDANQASQTNENAANNSAAANNQSNVGAEEAARLAAEQASKAQESSLNTKPFEELLAEKSGGKFKSWDEIEKVVSAPKVEFADPTIARLNELASKGVKIDREIPELQSKDYSTWTNPEEVSLEAMRLKPEYKGLSQSTLEYELNKKYSIDDWRDKDEADYTVEDKANVERFTRDAMNDREWLKNYRDERLLFREPSQDEIKANQDKASAAQAKWESYVDSDLSGKITGFSTIIDEGSKEAFDFSISESDRRDVANLMKSLTKDPNAMFNQFAEVDGNGNKQINHRKVYEMLVKSRNYDNAVKNAYNQGKAVGAKNFVKDDLKNINFTPSGGNTGNGAPQSEAEAIAMAMRRDGKKI